MLVLYILAKYKSYKGPSSKALPLRHHTQCRKMDARSDDDSDGDEWLPPATRVSRNGNNCFTTSFVIMRV